MNGEQPLVQCDDVARTYGNGTSAVVAVRGITCAVPPGARIALTGPSGCGKSTLLHLMAGLETPTAGTVTWPALTGRPPRSRQVGLAFQLPNLLPDLDVTENVALPLLLAGTAPLEATARARESLARLGIGQLAMALPEELSGGQGQRVAIARALVIRPQLILADEPTGQLDRDTAYQVVSVLLDAAHAAGAGLVVATHDVEVAERLTTRWPMRDGALTVPDAALR
jgi:ABC-type lipoprotein export system ATPase subunit